MTDTIQHLRSMMAKANADLAAEKDAKNRALTCAADYAEQVASITAQRDKLAGLLLEARDRMGCGCGECLCARCSETWDKTTTALAELEKSK